MKFYCIYTLDVPEDVKMDSYLRIIQKHGSEFWTETESDDLSSEYGYLGDEWEHGKHKKYVGDLTKDQFIEFVRASSLRPESCETMGMITENGMMPAIAFNGHDQDVIESMYVCPLPELRNQREGTPEAWDRIKSVILRMFEHN